jgi:hypothetical protein
MVADSRNSYFQQGAEFDMKWLSLQENAARAGELLSLTRSKKSWSVSRVMLPFHIVREDDFDSFLLQYSDAFDGFFGFLAICMYTARMTMRIIPLANGLLARQQASIVACVSSHIDAMTVGAACE